MRVSFLIGRNALKEGEMSSLGSEAALLAGRWQAIMLDAPVNGLKEHIEKNFHAEVLRRRCLLVHLSQGILRHLAGPAMGIALFFATATSNLPGELKVDRAGPSTRTCVHLHPGWIGNFISATAFSRPSTLLVPARKFATNRTEPTIGSQHRAPAPASV
jgi:hypothetical protein